MSRSALKPASDQSRRIASPRNRRNAGATAAGHPAASARPFRLVAVLVHGVEFWGGVIAGIEEYAAVAGDWKIAHFSLNSAGLKAACRWGAAGLLVPVCYRSFCQAVLRCRLPAVNISTSLEDVRLPLVNVDNLRVGRMAADFLRAGPYRHFAYFHLSTHWYSRLRRQGYVEYLAENGNPGPVSCFETTYHDYSELERRSRDLHRPAPVMKWLRELPKPVAIFACNDTYGLFLTRLCYRLELRIPDDVYILGVDNITGDMVYPALPSVEVPKQEIGYRAALMLDKLMKDQMVPNRTELIPPLRVVDRHLSRFTAAQGFEVWAARRFIQHHVDRQISVEQVAEAAGLSRRALELRFKAVVGHSVLEEIQLAHLERAREYLEKTDWPVEQVAEASGFREARHLRLVFQAKLGITPSEFRQQAHTALR